MQVVPIFSASSLRNYSYLIIPARHQGAFSGEVKGAIVVDPYHSAQIISKAKAVGVGLAVVINTHEHDDHLCGNEGLRQIKGIQFWAHPNLQAKVPYMNRALKAGERIALGPDEAMEVWYTPGHTAAHICLALYEKDQLTGMITGDTLFHAGVGNCKHGGDPETLFQTIDQKFQSLPSQVKIYPGHDYAMNNLAFSLSVTPDNTHIKRVRAEVEAYAARGQSWFSDFGTELQINHFLRTEADDVQRALLASSENPNGKLTKKQAFIRLRAMRDHW